VTSAGENSSPGSIRRISIVAPMRNEEEHVEHLVADVAGQDFDGEIEVLVADAASTDNSVERLTAAAASHGLDLTVLENPVGWVSHGLNACIRRATGELIVRLDCHSRYPTDYLRRCAVAAEETGAMNVGGLLVTVGRTPMERAVGLAMDGPFGGIDWTRNVTTSKRVEADTVPFGAFRPQAFELAGYFDETLVRDQDDEFNLRLRRAGGRVVLDPTIRAFYTPRGSLFAVLRQYYEYGFWKVPVMLKHRQVVSARGMVPLAFVGSLAVLLPSALRSKGARRLLGLELGAYAGCALCFGVRSVARRGEWQLLPRVVAASPAFHFGLGIGMLHGWFRAALRRGTPEDARDVRSRRRHEARD
jgi:succinoglycan biosynthesis protein ExoA